MKSNVELRYRRIGLHYTGEIDGVEFMHKTFEEMMLLTQARLLECPGCGLSISRTERPGLFPVQLEPELLQLLLTDPDQYIERHTIPDRIADLRPPDRVSKLAAPYQAPRGGLRAGHDTLADAFGDNVYLRMRAGKVENPCTGRWCSILELEEDLNRKGRQVKLVTDLPVLVTSDLLQRTGWLVIATSDLLQSAATRFYLPREWNESGSWVTKERLQELYDQFRKDREQCQ
jgi:hypothetical protein